MTLSRTTLPRTLRRTAIGLAVLAATTLIGASPATAAPAAAPPPCNGPPAKLLPPLRNAAGQMLGQASVRYCGGQRWDLRVDDTRANGLQFGLVVGVPDGRRIPYPELGDSYSEPDTYYINYPVSYFQVCDGLNTSTPYCAARVYNGVN